MFNAIQQSKRTYLRLVADTVNVSDNDKVPEITHEESCYFELGPIAIGNCSAKPDLDSEES